MTESTTHRLDFSYATPNKQAADALCQQLTESTEYEVTVASRGNLFWKRWILSGSTQPTQLSLEMLDEWVTRMVTAGQAWGGEFDGWGTSI